MDTRTNQSPYKSPDSNLIRDVEFGEDEEPGWRGLAVIRKVAVIVNALLGLLLGAVSALLLQTMATGPSIAVRAWIAALAGSCIATIVGLWPARQLAWMRVLTSALNLAWVIGLGYQTNAIFTQGSEGGPRLVALGYMFAVACFAPAIALVAQVSAFRFRR